MKFKLTGIVAIAAMGLSFLACDNEKSDNSSMLLLMTKARMTAQARATAVSNSVSTGVPAAVGNGGLAFNKAMDQQKLMIAILNNGNDPVFAKEAVTEYIALQGLEKASPRAKLATSTTVTIDGGFPTTVGDVKTYQFSGYINGKGATLVTLPFLLCNINIYQDSGTPQGTMTFSAGSTLVYTGTFASSTSFTGSAEFNSNLTYDNFGVIYPDYATIIKMIKTPSIGVICSAANSLAKYVIIKSGTVTANMVANYSAFNSATTFSSAADFKVTLNSPAGIVIQPNGGTSEVTLTLENVVYDYNSNITVNQSNIDGALTHLITGNLSLVFSGTVNGNSIDETIAINL